jgi:hypothetical protein
MAAPTLLIADTTGATSGTITYGAGHANHVRLGDRTYQNLRTGTFEWHTSTQRCTPIGYTDGGSSWRWTASGANANAYYVRYYASSQFVNPQIPNDTNRRVLENGTPLALGASVAALAAGEYFYGDADTLGYSTVYVRLSDDADPDSKATDYIQFDTPLWYLTAASGADPSIGSPTNRIVYIGDYIAPLAGSSSTVGERQSYIGDLDTLGFNTIYVCPRQKYSTPEAGASWAVMDSQTDGYVYQSYDNASFSWGAGGPATANRIRWDFKLAGVIVRTVYGFNAGCDLEHDAVTVTVENEDGLTASATRVCSQTAFSGTTHYVATAGNNTTGDGSEGNPWETVAKAVTELGASNSNRRIMLNGGDTHAWAGGTITGSNWIIDAYGTGTPTLEMSGAIEIRGDNIAVRNVRLGNGAFTSSGGSGNDGLTLANLSLFGNISTFVNVDRIRTGILMRDISCEDLSGSTYGGMRAYMIYTVSVPSVVCAPFRLICLDNVSNDYGHRDEAAIRMGGDYVCLYRCNIEQTNLTSSYRNKCAGPRIVGGTHWWVSECQFRVPEDTTGKSLNSSQGTSGMEFSPGDGQSFAVRWCVGDRNKFIGCGFSAELRSAGQTTYSDDVTMRATIIDCKQYPKHSYRFITLNPQHYATCARWKILNVSILSDNDATLDLSYRPLDLYDAPIGLCLTDTVIENVLCINPSCAVVNNATKVPAFLLFRTEDAGVTEFASIAHNVYPAANTDAAGGNYAGTGASMFTTRSRNAAESASTYWGFDDLNGTDYASDNTLENVTVDSEHRISGSPTAKTQCVRSTGCRYDYYGREIPATGGAVGAVQPGLIHTVIQAGANVLALAR